MSEPIDLAEIVRRARAERDPQILCGVVPYAAFVGMSMRLDEAGDVVATMRYADHLIGDSTLPALHGGTIAALLESTAIFTALFLGDDVGLPRTITLTIDYLRSGRAQDTECRARVVRRGRRILVLESSAYQGSPDKPITKATVHLLLGDRLP